MNPLHVNIRIKGELSLSQGITVAQCEGWCRQEKGSKDEKICSV
jgi:hypothetical protein